MQYLSRMATLILRRSVIVGVIVVATVTWVWRSHSATEVVVSEPPIVAVASVMKADIAHIQSLTGTIAPSREVDIAAKTSGRITRLSVDAGSRVWDGSPIAQLDVSTAVATQKSIEGNIAATQATLDATKNLYDTRIASMESVASATDSAALQTTGASTVTDAAVLAQQIDDTLGNLLSVRGSQITGIQIPFDTELGVHDSQSKITARNDLEAYQAADAAFQTFIMGSVVNKNPSQVTVNDGLSRAARVLGNAQTILKDTYTVLSASLVTGNLTETQLAGYKTQVAAFGTQAQQILGQIHDVAANIATLKMESDAQIASANEQLVQLQGQATVNQTILADGGILAPFSGVVTQKYVDEGTVVAPGTPLVHIVDDSVVKIVVGISDSIASTVHVGDRALVAEDGLSQTVNARVSTIHPAVDPVSRKIAVELIIDNGGHVMKIGSYAHVIFSQQGTSTLAAPRSAVLSRYGSSFVFVLDGTTVHQKVVTTGAVSDTLVEITNGLNEGDVVVTAGNDYLRDGDTVATSTSKTH